MRRKIRLTESDFHKIINQSVMRILKEYRQGSDDWYQEEDYDGNTGEPGMVRSYDVGGYYMDNAEIDAEENGYDDVAEYLKYWFFEIQPECPWYWQRLGSGYGYHGNTIFFEHNVECKEIYGQIMFDEYGPDADNMTMTESINKLNEGRQNQNYTHFAVNKFTNLIVNGWDYSDYSREDLMSDKNYFFFDDLKDYGFNPKAYKIVGKKFADKAGITQWSNTGVYSLGEEIEMNRNGIDFYTQAHTEHPDWFID